MAVSPKRLLTKLSEDFIQSSGVPSRRLTDLYNIASKKDRFKKWSAGIALGFTPAVMAFAIATTAIEAGNIHSVNMEFMAGLMVPPLALASLFGYGAARSIRGALHMSDPDPRQEIMESAEMQLRKKVRRGLPGP